MQRAIQIFGWLFLASIVLLNVDNYFVEAKDSRVSHAVSRLNGRMASLPFLPFGTEYVISFSRRLTDDELNSLSELNSLRGYVGVHFKDCDLSKAQLERIRNKLSGCNVIWDNSDFTE